MLSLSSLIGMISVYAKNLGGNIITLSVPSENTWNSINTSLSTLLCSDDPSRLILLPFSSECDEECDEEYDEKGEEETIDPLWGLNYEWKDGDSVLYFIKDARPICVNFDKYSSDYSYKDIHYYIVNIKVIDAESESNLFEYSFAFSYEKNIYIRSSQFYIEYDEENSYLNIDKNATKWSCIYDMINYDESIPSPFRYAIYRSIHRKWSSHLKYKFYFIGRIMKNIKNMRNMKNNTKRSSRNQYRHKKYSEEREMVYNIYKQIRYTPPPYLRKVY